MWVPAWNVEVVANSLTTREAAGMSVPNPQSKLQLALADGPRGVVCDLSAVPTGARPVAVDLLATAGRHVRHWPGIPVAVACADPRIREALAAHPLGAKLIITTSAFSAVSMVLGESHPGR
jgi:hypothetical protein